MVSSGRISVILADKTNRNLHPGHLALTPSDAAFTSTHPAAACEVAISVGSAGRARSTRRILRTATVMGRKQTTGNVLNARAKTNGYKRGAHREEDSRRDCSKQRWIGMCCKGALSTPLKRSILMWSFSWQLETCILCASKPLPFFTSRAVSRSRASALWRNANST
jgi:hypothetical protein